MQAAQSTNNWHRMWDVYHDALEQPTDRRRAFVTAASGDDNALCAEVNSLLDSHDQAGDGFLVPVRAFDLSPPSADAPAAPLTGKRVGRYQVGRLLAEGGSAVVYEAQQFDPPKMVALKVMRRGIGDRRAMQRFESEAAMLARLDHPGIAQVFEAGSFDLGDGAQPYFALELVRGERLCEFATERALNLAARLELLIDVSEAVNHAHLRGVVHRDLKPSNILVQVDDEARAPQVKVLDFGVAQLTDGDIQATRTTVLSEVAGTLPYMSPEQIAGDVIRIDARSDVYALGVVSYELLAGRLPLNFESASLFEAIRVIREGEPLRLGTIERRLQGDVELIVHKALEKEPIRRYQSAAEFAADLRRVLGHEPVMARPATRLYRLTRFTQRNRANVIGLLVAAAALLTGAVLATWQAIEARHAERLATKRAMDTRAFAASVLDSLQQAISALPETTSIRAEWISQSVNYLDGLIEPFHDDPDFLFLTGKAHERLATVLGSIRNASLNDTRGALAEYDKALAVLGSASALAPQRGDITSAMGYVQLKRMDTLRTRERLDESIAAGIAGGELLLQCAKGRACDEALNGISGWRIAAMVASLKEDGETVERLRQRSLHEIERLRIPPNDQTQEQLYLGRIWAEYGRQVMEARDISSASRLFARSLSIIEQAEALGADSARVAEFKLDVLRSRCALLWMTKSYADALNDALECTDLARESIRAFPDNRSLYSLLEHALTYSAECLMHLGRYDEAIAKARESQDVGRTARAFEPTSLILIGTEMCASLALLESLVTAAEHAPGDARTSAWLTEARKLAAQLQATWDQSFAQLNEQERMVAPVAFVEDMRVLNERLSRMKP